VGVTEVPTATRNPFSFVYTFGDGFTNVSGSPDDQFSFSDDPQFNVGVALQDFFSLDDFNQIDKETGANKTNVYSMQDEHAFSFSKLAADAFVFSDPAVIDVETTKSDSFSFSDDHSLGFSKSAADSYALSEADTKVFGKTLQDSTNPLTDNAIFAFTKAASENIIVSEVQAFNVSKSAQDSTSISDTPVLSPRKGISDSVTMGDLLVAQRLVASSILNKGDLGFMLLNAD